jgi:hypothetical protein
MEKGKQRPQRPNAELIVVGPADTGGPNRGAWEAAGEALGTGILGFSNWKNHWSKVKRKRCPASACEPRARWSFGPLASGNRADDQRRCFRPSALRRMNGGLCQDGPLAVETRRKLPIALSRQDGDLGARFPFPARSFARTALCVHAGRIARTASSSTTQDIAMLQSETACCTLLLCSALRARRHSPWIR